MRFLGYLYHETDLFTYLPPFNTTTLIKPMNEEEEEALWRTHVFAETVLPGRGTLFDLRSNVWWMPADG
jgi:hypothetical protein